MPEANIGIIASGTGSKREYVQRLGRILRKKEGKEAVLYEIIATETTETGTAKRRKQAVSTRRRRENPENETNPINQNKPQNDSLSQMKEKVDPRNSGGYSSDYI